MASYRTKAETRREAMQLPDVTNIKARLVFDDWIVEHKGETSCRYRGDTLQIVMRGVIRTAYPGNFLVVLPDGGFAIMSKDAFDDAYEPVNPRAAR